MFDDPTRLEGPIEGEKDSSDEKDTRTKFPSGWLAIITLLVFCLLYFPFRNHFWSWFVAIAGSYSVAVFGIALGSALDDAADFFGDPRVPKYVATLLLPHILILAFLMLGAYLWLHIKPELPHWVTVEGHRGSLWEFFGELLLLIAAIKEGTWLGDWIKRRFGTGDNSNQP